MVSQNDLITRIVAIVSGFDDAAWEALASTGLLRRARKDIEKGLAIEVLGVENEAVRVNVPPFVVTMPASGPAKARCSCPAPGVCQHIIAAGLYLQTFSAVADEPKTVHTESSIRSEITLLTPERLKAWAGSADYRAGVALFEKNSLPPVISYEDTVLVRLLPTGLETRFMPAAGLDGMILPQPQKKRAGVAAILALRQSLGLPIPTASAQKALVDLGGTPRTPKEILDSACALFEEAIAVGLSHVSAVLADRMVTLAVSAQGANLYRVSLGLKSVADEVRSILQREARADEARLLLLMANIYALMDVIRSAGDNRNLDLAGAPRGQYVDVPEIELSGVGAYTWQTGSGYRGLTVLFWSSQSQEFLSWSDTRPDERSFDPRQRFFADGPWDGAQSPQQVAAASLKLRHARRTANGRLSSSTKTSALVLSPTDPQGLEFGERLFRSWGSLFQYVWQKQPLGLREPNPLDLIAVLEPAGYGAKKFDPIEQTWLWTLYDDLGMELTLSLPFRDWSKESIAILENLLPPEGSRWRFVVRLALEGGALSVEPISILRADDPEIRVFQLAFDALPKQNPALAHHELAEVKDDADEPDEEFPIFDTDLSTGSYRDRVIGELNDHLQAIAEAGLESGFSRHRAWCETVGGELQRSGLTLLDRVVNELSKSLPSPDLLLKARYLTLLHSQAGSHFELI